MLLPSGAGRQKRTLQDGGCWLHTRNRTHARMRFHVHASKGMQPPEDNHTSNHDCGSTCTHTYIRIHSVFWTAGIMGHALLMELSVTIAMNYTPPARVVCTHVPSYRHDP